MTLLASPGVAGSAVLATSVITDMEKVLAAAIQAATPHIPIQTILPRVPILNPGLNPTINPAVIATPPLSPTTVAPPITPPITPGTTPPIIALNPAAIAAIRTAPVATTLSPLTTRAALSASAAAFSAAAPQIPTTIATPPTDSVPTNGTPPTTPTPTPAPTVSVPPAAVNLPPAGVLLPPSGTTLLALNGGLLLGETQVAAVAVNYADPRLGDGLARAAAALAGLDPADTATNPWPSDPDVLWLGQSGLALVVDAAFRTVAAERLADSATLLKTAVSAQDTTAVTDLVQQMT
jgi:hypothetical protein